MLGLDFKNQATVRNLLCGVLAAAALAVYLFTHFLPFGYRNRDEKITALKAEYEKKSTELARARASVADLPRFEAEYEQLHQRWSMAAELLPTDRQSAALLRKITLAGQQTGVQFLMFKPQPTKSQTYYTEIPVEVVVHGTYHQVGSFLAELANMRRIVTVASLKLTSAPANDYSNTTGAAFSATAFSLNTAPAATAKPKTVPASSQTAPSKEESHAHPGS